MENVITEVEYIPIKPKAGCLGFVCFVLYGSLYCGSVAVYSRPTGGIRLVWPKIKNRGHQFPTVHPISETLANNIESVIREYVSKRLPISDDQLKDYDQDATVGLQG